MTGLQRMNAAPIDPSGPEYEALRDAAIEVCADHFDPSTLSPDALVSRVGVDRVARLIGWNETARAWDCEDVIEGRVTADRLVDPYMVRRVLVLIYRRRLSQFPWETHPVALEKIQALEAEILARLAS